MKNYIKTKKTYIPNINLNLNVRGLSQSATLAINQRCQQLIQQGKEVFRLGLGQSPFPVPEPVVEALKANAHKKDYLPVEGLYELRREVAEYYQRSQGLTRDPEDVLIGPGSKELMFLIQLVYYGDLVIPTPSWVSYAPQAQIIGRPINWISTEPENCWRLYPEKIEELCRKDPERPRIVILNYPNNPTGCTYNLDELKAIAQVARRYRVILLSDEIYGELHHKGHHVSVARFYPEGTIISSGLSKWCGAGGWRLGTFVFPPSLRWLLNAMAAVASETYTSTSTPVQFAAVRAFQGGPEIEKYLWNSRRILRTLGRYIMTKFREVGISAPDPQGAFYLFPNFEAFRAALIARGIYTSEQLCNCLLEETGVAILPGSAFGCKPEILTARLAYVDFDGENALKAVESIPPHRQINGEFIHKHFNKIVTAINRLCAWVVDLQHAHIEL